MCRYLYANGNTADGTFLANGTWVLNKHIWWTKREGVPITSPLPRKWHRPCRMGGCEVHVTMISKVTRAWIESNKLYKSVPHTPGGPIIC